MYDELGSNRVIFRAEQPTKFKLSNEIHDNSALTLYLQTNLEATRENVLSELVEYVAHAKFMCTKEQLCTPNFIFVSCYIYLTWSCSQGYYVTCEVKNLNGVRGLFFVVQGGKSPQELEKRVEAFLSKMKVMWLNKNGSKHKNVHQYLARGNVGQRGENPNTLGQQSDKFWDEIRPPVGRSAKNRSTIKIDSRGDVIFIHGNNLNFNRTVCSADHSTEAESLRSTGTLHDQASLRWSRRYCIVCHHTLICQSSVKFLCIVFSAIIARLLVFYERIVELRLYAWTLA